MTEMVSQQPTAEVRTTNTKQHAAGVVSTEGSRQAVTTRLPELSTEAQEAHQRWPATMSRVSSTTAGVVTPAASRAGSCESGRGRRGGSGAAGRTVGDVHRSQRLGSGRRFGASRRIGLHGHWRRSPRSRPPVRNVYGWCRNAR